MNRTFAFLPSTVLLVLPLLAPKLAHAQAKPTIQRSAVPTGFELLSISEIQSNALMTLTFTPTIVASDTYEYELTFDRPRSETLDAPLVVLEETPTNSNRGTVANGQTVSFTIRPTEVLAPATLPGGGGELDDGERKIFVRVFRSSNPFEETTSESANWSFKFDTRVPPTPEIRTLTPGESRIELSFRISTELDVEGYEIAWRPEVPGSDTATDCDALAQKLTGALLTRAEAPIQKGETTMSLESEDLRTGVCAAVAIRAFDDVGNRGEYSVPRGAAPRDVLDYFELVRAQGLQEDGGFCFIATAAYGSYAHPAVRLLRAFRDYYLSTGPLGRAAVAFYYDRSPPIADAIRRSPALATAVRMYLWPAALLGVGAVLSPLFLLLLMRRQIRFGRRLSGAGLVAALVMFAPLSAKAAFPEWGVGIGVKGGPYLPAMGDPEVGGAQVATFQGVFLGEDETEVGPGAMPSIDIDIDIYRGYGTAGVGVSAGFLIFSGKGRFLEDSTQVSGDETALHIVPLSLNLFYRFDWLAYKYSIPVVPYLRGGLAYFAWWVTDGNGDLSEDGSATGRGGKFGLSGTVGLALLLNDVEPRAAYALKESMGIRGTSIFAEWQSRSGDGFGSGGFDFGSSSWNAGIYFEF